MSFTVNFVKDPIVPSVEAIEDLQRCVNYWGDRCCKAEAEVSRLRAERDEWKAKWMSLAAASLIAGTMTLEQKADTE